MTDMIGMTDRIRQVMEHLGLSRLEFSKALGMPNQTRFRQILNHGKLPQPYDLDRIVYAFPQISIDWLFEGKGEMLRPSPLPQAGQNRGIGSIGRITGGVNSFRTSRSSQVVTGSASGGIVAGAVSGTVNVNHNGGKDELINEQKEEVNKMFEAIIVAVNGFQQSSKRHDEYIVNQDEYIKGQAERIDRIISNAYLRNERNMERIDRAIVQQNAVIAQQTKLIELVFEQSKRTQDRADALLELLIKKS